VGLRGTELRERRRGGEQGGVLFSRMCANPRSTQKFFSSPSAHPLLYTLFLSRSAHVLNVGFNPVPEFKRRLLSAASKSAVQNICGSVDRLWQ